MAAMLPRCHACLPRTHFVGSTTGASQRSALGAKSTYHESWSPRVRLLVVLSLLSGCSPAWRSGHAEAPVHTLQALVLAPDSSAVVPASIAASAGRAFASAGPGELLFVGELMEGDPDCTAKYGFSFANEVFGPTEGEDDEGRHFR